MSGPKESFWEIDPRIREELRRQRAQERARQVVEIEAEIEKCNQRMRDIQQTHGRYADYLAHRVEAWLQEVSNNCSGDLRQSWRGLKGTSRYLESQQRKLTEKAQAAKQRQQQKAQYREAQALSAANEIDTLREQQDDLREELGIQVQPLLEKTRQWLADAQQQLQEANPRGASQAIKGIKHYMLTHEQELSDIRNQQLQREHTKRRIAELEAVREDFREIINPGIEQRIALFSKSLSANPDNPNILKQIDAFKAQLHEIMEKHQEVQAQLAHVGQALSEALGGDAEEGSDGSSIISGEIEGVPIRATLHSNNSIHFDTPTDGSCRKAMNTLSRSLQEANIGLGPIRILNTGETIDDKASNLAGPGIRA